MQIFRRSRPSFKTLLAGRLLLLTLSSVLAVSLFAARFLGSQMKNDAAEHLREAALRVRDGLESYLHLHASAIAGGSAFLMPKPHEPISAGAAAVWLENTGKVYPGFLTMLVTDERGRIIRALRRGEASFTPSEPQSQWVADRPYFLRPKVTGQPFVSGVFQGRGLGHNPIVAISAPISDSAGRFAGVVEGSIDITRIPLAPSDVHYHPLVIAQDAEQHVVYSTRSDLHQPLQLWKPVMPTAPVSEGNLFILSDPGQRDPHGAMIPQFAVHLPVHVAGWQVLAFLSVDTVDREIYQFYLMVAAALLVLSALTWQAANLIARSVAQPIVSLAREMQQYQVEEPSTPEAAKQPVAREIAQIQAEFRRLSVRLRELFLDLDQKVTERTAQLAESEARYRQVIEHSEDIIYRTDAAGAITFHNGAFEALFGADVVGRYMQELSDEATQSMLEAQVVRQIEERIPLLYLTFAITRLDGSSCWIGQSTQLLVDDAGQVLGFQAIARDVTEQVLAEHALREAEERYALAVRGSNNGIWDWDLRTGQVYYSERWKQMLGVSGTANGLDVWLSRVHPRDVDRLQEQLDRYVCDGSAGLFESEHRMHHADGTWRWVVTCGAAVRGSSGAALRVAGSTTDVTSGKLADPLTGLPNRLAIVERLEQLTARQKEDPTRQFALLFLDLDRFKLINDSLGHLKGDHLLLSVSRRLLTSLYSVEECTGCVGRLGGDEFVVVLEDMQGPATAARVAAAIQKEMEEPFHLDGSLIFASVSIGIAQSDSSLRVAEEILRDADTAMYQAKTDGPGKYRLFDSSMRTRAVARLELETDLRHGLEAGQFVLHFQPQVCLLTGRLSGFEALVRWNHPRRGLVQPAEFISIAEENGLILPLGRWVLETGCRQLAEWHQQYASCRELSMSINLSALQFNDPSFSSLLADILRDTGLHPSRLHLELTESMVADDPADAHRILNALAEMGVGLEVDDFGTGYSCLSQLHQLPFNTLKIDRSFVKTMGQQVENSLQDGRKIVESILTLSANLGIEVIAEGIETEAHWTQLALLGCQFGQGYYFSRPVAPEQAVALAEFRRATPWAMPAELIKHSPGLIHLNRSLEKSRQ